MGNESGGEPGCSGLQDMKKLLEKTREKYQFLNPNRTAWPCSFCLHKAETLIQCKIHIKTEHKIITTKDVEDALSQSQTNVVDDGEKTNFSQDDLKQFLKLIENDIENSTPEMASNCLKCNRRGFIAKNKRGLSIHTTSCIKKNSIADDSQKETTSEGNETLIESLINIRGQRRAMNRIPKGARKIVCEEYTKIIIECVSDNSETT